MSWITEVLRSNPSIAIFLTIGVGFWIGRLKFKGFSLGIVTSVLLVGVLVGQLNIPIPGPIKQVFFLLFLFAIGYSVGPQFFRSLRGSGLKEVIFAVVICFLCLIVTYVCAKLMGYNPGEAIGLFSGAQTISAVIGVGTDTMSTLGLSKDHVKEWTAMIPVCYAVTYVFGTIGSAYILGNIGPWMLGGIKKVRAQTAELERQMNQSSITNDPAYVMANRPISFRAYKAESDFFATPRTVSEIEEHVASLGRRLFVERVRIDGNVMAPTPDMKISKNDEVVLSGRREYIIEDESWIGPEVNDMQLLDFPAEVLPVMISKKLPKGTTVDSLRAQKYMYGVSIKSITRSDVPIPVLAKTELYSGDMITLVGIDREVNAAAKQIGYADRPVNSSDMVFVGIGIVLGCLLGILAIHVGGVPITLSTSGGTLIAGLTLGWLRSKHPTFGRIPQPAVWVFNNVGLNMFIAVIGITSGPSFISGLEQVGFALFGIGIVCTTVPLLLGIIIGQKIFKFHPAINLGCCAGGRTTTASLGAVQEQLQSTLPAMGYTITYAVGNTLLILCGVAMVIMVV